MSDCEDGLVCIPQTDGSRTCGNDLTLIENPAEAPGGGDAGPQPAADATAADATGDANPPPPPKDAGTDTNPPPPKDAGTDTAQPPVDAAGE
jgi:hypothetical protein